LGNKKYGRGVKRNQSAFEKVKERASKRRERIRVSEQDASKALIGPAVESFPRSGIICLQKKKT